MSNHEVVYVTITIPDDTIEEFMKVMKYDAEESRKEEGCMRFDLLQDRDNKNIFHLYEIFVSAEANALHRTLPHYKAWADFKAANPSVGETQTVDKSFHVI